MRLPLRRRALVSALAAVFLVTAPAGPAHAALPSKAHWLSDVRTVMTGATAYLDGRVAQGGTKLAINLDIDNTSIATHYDPMHHVYVVQQWAKRAHDVKRVHLLFNTGRYQDQLSGISKVLKAEGYPYSEICGRRHGESLWDSKQRCRQHFIDEGYTIVVNVGNRSPDFAGPANYGKAYRLPNYDGQLS